MAKSNSFVVVSMVGIVAIVALIVLLSPSMNFDDNLAGVAISFEKDYTVSKDDSGLYEKTYDVVYSGIETDLTQVKEEDYAVVGGIQEEAPVKEEVELVAVDVIEAEYSYVEEPETVIVSGISESLPEYGTGEGVSDDPEEPVGTEPSEPATAIAPGEYITDVSLSCTDSDGGFVLNVVGITIGPDLNGVVTSHTDYCDGSRHVVEGTCEGGEIHVARSRCPRGGRCSSGACSR